jgi:hypothetical protein
MNANIFIKYCINCEYIILRNILSLYNLYIPINENIIVKSVFIISLSIYKYYNIKNITTNLTKLFDFFKNFFEKGFLNFFFIFLNFLSKFVVIFYVLFN